MTYHKRYRHIHRGTLNATKRLFAGWGDLTEQQRFDKSRQWLQEVSAVYYVNEPTLVIDRRAGTGFYQPWTNTIHMAYPSIVTLAHEFRHAYQHSHPSRMVSDIEDDARAWSLSLYHRVAPRTMRKLVQEGKIYFVTAQDMV